MPPRAESYVIPVRLDDALARLEAEAGRAAVVSGGTVLSLNRAPRIVTLIDLLRCGLDEIEISSKAARLGATVSAAAIAGQPKLDAFGAGILREAAAAIAPQAVRNQVTLGGNLVGVLSWTDLPVALMAVGARVQTARSGGFGRRLSLEELFAAHPRKILKRDELIVSVEIDRPAKTTGGAFIKLTPTISDVAWVNAAAVLDVRDGVCHSARVAVGAVQPRHFRATDTEKLLVGKKLTSELVAEAAAAGASNVKIWGDVRASKTYRARVLEVAIRRALATAWKRAHGRERYEAPRRVMPPPWTRKPAGPDVGHILTARIDGSTHRIRIQPQEVLLTALRRGGVLSVKRGCDEGYCGTCAVSVDGRLMNACMTFAAQVDGCEITTAS
ncbi:MAG: FAD binding domain-containing protein, partial [Myxococcota bacterium]